MKRLLLITIIIYFLSNCNPAGETADDTKTNLLFFLNKVSRATVSGKAMKGRISNGKVNVYATSTTGTCDTTTSLGTTTTDLEGNYEVNFTKTGYPVCVIVTPGTDSKMYDEAQKKDLNWTGSASMTIIINEPKTARKGVNGTPFARFAAARFQEIAKSNSGRSAIADQVTYANKTTVVQFGLNRSFIRRPEVMFDKITKIDMDTIPDVLSEEIDLDDKTNNTSTYMTAFLGGISTKAKDYKGNAEGSADYIESFLDALSKDLADGKADGKDATGTTVTVSVDGTPTAVPTITEIKAAVLTYAASNPGLGITTTEIQNTTVVDAPVFVQSTPVSVGTTTTASGTFTIGGTISGLTASGLVLQNNAGDNLTVASGATSFTFATALASGAAYSVTVLAQPSGQTCTVSAGSGTTSANVTNVSVSCTSMNITGAVTTIAGTVGVSGSTDGTGTGATFNGPRGIATDGTNLYIADYGAAIIRKVVISTGVVTKIAGTAGSTGTTDGAGASALFWGPISLAFAGSNLYIAELENARIRKLDTTTNTVSTITTAILKPYGITTDGTNLYVASYNTENKIYKIPISTGVPAVLAGNGTLASTDNATGTSASFNGPVGMATDGTNVYVSEAGSAIRKVSISSGAVSTIAGLNSSTGTTDATGTSARFNQPIGMYCYGNYLYVADYANHSIRKIDTSSLVVTTIAGSSGTTGSSDGTGTSARFNYPFGITSDGTYLYVADYVNQTIRRIQ